LGTQLGRDRPDTGDKRIGFLLLVHRALLVIDNRTAPPPAQDNATHLCSNESRVVRCEINPLHIRW
jgi:hypothetical protein